MTDFCHLLKKLVLPPKTIFAKMMFFVETIGFLPRSGNKKLRYRRGTARCVVSIEILPIAMQQCRNYLYDKS